MGSFCPNCNQQYDADGGYCPFDGTPLVAGAPETVPDTGVRVLSAIDAARTLDDESIAKFAANARRERAAEYDRLVGTTLDGRYRIERKLGEGGMGVVFLAHHVVIEKPVAIKVLKREVAREQSTVKRFVQEARAASRIGHPNIVDVTDFGTTPDGMTYSVMEYVSGATLSQVTKASGPMPIARALPICAQIARALAAAHEKGIVHRDLKPDNVFVIDRDGRVDFVKIVDFGIAKVTPVDGRTPAPRLTAVGSVFGTPEYMAPEQAAGRTDTDQRVDIYALGTILYELLVGRVPHKGDSMVRTLAMQMLEPIEPPRAVAPALAISDELERVIMTALAKRREDRYQTMRAFLQALEGVSGGVPLSQPLSGSGAVRAMSQVASPTASTMVPTDPREDIAPRSPPTMPEPGRAEAHAEPMRHAPAHAHRAPSAPVHDVPAHAPRAPSAPVHAPSPSQSPSQSAAPSSGVPIALDGPHGRDASAPVFDDTARITHGAARRAGTSEQPDADDLAEQRRRKARVEPAFVARKRPLSLSIIDEPAPEPPRPSRWPIYAVLLALFGIGGVAIAMLAKRSGDESRVAVAPGTVDAAPTHATPADAAPIVADPDAASETLTPDAGSTAGPVGTRPVRPRNRRNGDARRGVDRPDPAPPRSHEVKVFTRPDGATLYVGGTYSGVSGTTIVRNEGEAITVICKKPGYSDGKVRIAFDGATEIAMCVMKRVAKCVPGIKNPFDDCPEE